ncbi:hypothetical protein QQ045_023784 [Rhodiola kirilowii]
MYFRFLKIEMCLIMKLCCCCEARGDVNAVDKAEQTALHCAAVRGSISVADLLLQNGARVEAADANGFRGRFYLFTVGFFILCKLNMQYTLSWVSKASLLINFGFDLAFLVWSNSFLGSSYFQV